VITRVRTRGARRLAAIAAGLVVTASVLAIPGVSRSEAETAPASGGQPAASSTSSDEVVRTSRVVPARRKVVRIRFRPWARPSPAKVRKLIRLEAKRWGIPAGGLSRRVACESGFRWNPGGGPYYGLLQFAPSTFARGLRSIRTRKVVVVKRRTRRVWEKRIVHMSNGEVRREKVRKVRQRVKRVYVGKLPRRPAVTHGWAQIRIGAQAIRGISAVRSSEWGCPA
jgi:hypothetical protein